MTTRTTGLSNGNGEWREKGAPRCSATFPRYSRVSDLQFLPRFIPLVLTHPARHPSGLSPLFRSRASFANSRSFILWLPPPLPHSSKHLGHPPCADKVPRLGARDLVLHATFRHIGYSARDKRDNGRSCEMLSLVSRKITLAIDYLPRQDLFSLCIFSQTISFSRDQDNCTFVLHAFHVTLITEKDNRR